MKKQITFIFAALIIISIFTSCSKNVEKTNTDEQLQKNVDNVEPNLPDNTITKDISEVDTLEDTLDENEVDLKLNDAEEIINNW